MARYVRVQNIRHEIGRDGRFELSLTSADVRVRATDGTEVSLRATFEIRAGSESEADEIYQRVALIPQAGAGRLSVQEPEGPASLRGVLDRLLRAQGSVDLAIEVDMPHSAAVRLETVSGDVTADGLRGEQRYTTVSGDLFVSDGGGSLRVNTVSGDVTVRADRPLSLRSDAVSGDLSLAAPRIDGLRAHAVSGDVEVEGELALGGEFRAETVSGDVTVGLAGGATFEVRGISTDISSDLDHRIEGHQDRRRVVIGSGRPTFLFNSMSGDLAIHRPRRVVIPAPVGSRAESRRLSETDELAVLQALERGDIDVEEATRRLGGGGEDA